MRFGNLRFLQKIKDQSNSLHSVRFCNISVTPGDRAPFEFLETHGNFVRLGRSAHTNKAPRAGVQLVVHTSIKLF